MVNDLFLVPFMAGLALAVLLPLLGCFLRLREEWLAALAYAHVAAAGALLALVAGAPPAAGGIVAAGVAGGGKRLLARRFAGGAHLALFLIGGWALAVLLAANQPLAERLGHALFDGQLYFAGTDDLWIAAVGCAAGVAILARLSQPLLLAHVYPDLFRARGFHVWPVETGFDLLAALGLALATMTLGVMGAFALVFVPPWLAFRRAPDWRGGLWLAMAIGVVAYVAAFALALVLDQPFGPVLALLLVLVGLVIA
jgi:zinc transport system permease protein